MDAKLTFDLPAIECPESRLFGYPTRVADAWSPGVEAVVEKACVLPPSRMTFRIERGSTASLGIPAWSRNPLRRLRRRVAPLDLGHRIVMDLRGDGITNYSLFITNAAEPTLVFRSLLRDLGPDAASLVVLLNGHAPRHASEGLDGMGIRWIATDAEARGRIVFRSFESERPAPFVFLPDLVPATGSDDGFSPERVFINRRQSRCLANEAEVVRFLEGRGFHCCTFEGMPLRRQWAMLRRAREIVAIHGAGMINMLFNRLRSEGDGPKVVEIFPSGFKVTYFRYLVAALHGHWCAVRAQLTPDVVRDLDERELPLSHAYDPIRVHVDSLVAALDYLA